MLGVKPMFHNKTSLSLSWWKRAVWSQQFSTQYSSSWPRWQRSARWRSLCFPGASGQRPVLVSSSGWCRLLRAGWSAIRWSWSPSPKHRRCSGQKLLTFLYHLSPLCGWPLPYNIRVGNLAAIQNLKEYMAGEIGVKDGEMIVESKGLHLYGYAEDLAKLRCLRD